MGVAQVVDADVEVDPGALKGGQPDPRAERVAGDRVAAGDLGRGEDQVVAAESEPFDAAGDPTRSTWPPSARTTASSTTPSGPTRPCPGACSWTSTSAWPTPRPQLPRTPGPASA